MWVVWPPGCCKLDKKMSIYYPKNNMTFLAKGLLSKIRFVSFPKNQNSPNFNCPCILNVRMMGLVE